MKYIELENHIELEIHPINQNGAQFYVGKLSASLLLETYTVRPTEYDLNAHKEFARTFEDEADYFNTLIDLDKKKLDDKSFQRTYNKARLSSITQYLNEELYPFFPNAIIVNCELINKFGQDAGYGITSKDQFYNANDKPKHLSYFDEETNTLIIPKRKGSILVIDGQHRIKGLESSSIRHNYEVLLSFIIGVDRTIVAKQFYTVNYEQKSVNKSLLYHLTGEFSNEIDELSLMHNVVRALNEIDKSPFHGRIKMLGVSPPNATDDEKKMMSLSQAFLVDALLKTVSKNAVNSKYMPIFIFQFSKKDYQAEIIRFLIKFFEAISELKDDWNHPESSILSKGMGVGAFLKVLQLIYPVIIDKEMINQNRGYLKVGEINKDVLKKYLNGIQNVDLSKEGPFGGVGSAGSINKIKEAIVENLIHLKEVLGYETYSEFLDRSNDYQSSFINFLKRFYG